MTYKIVADSSSNITRFEGADLVTVPLKIITSQKEYEDTPELNVDEMVADLREYSGRSSTSCPSVGDWLAAFGEADRVFAITITSQLSGSFASAFQAKQQYEEMYPDKKVCVVDTLSTGATMVFTAEKIRDMIAAGAEYDDICMELQSYLKHTELFFMLKSMRNLANNGRVSHAVAKIAGVLGIHVLGVASEEGTIALMNKCRTQTSALRKIVSGMAERGYSGGKICITHTQNPEGAEELVGMIRSQFPNAKEITVSENRALCSYYAELGGIIIGFETK